MRWIAGLLALAVVAHGAPQDGKAFSLFSVVTFPNEECATQMKSSLKMSGVCQTSEECDDNGGEKSGNCASGFGVCCFYKVDDCKTEITNNITYIQNEDYPSTITSLSSCEYKVKGSSNVCSIRLDFDNFVLDSPTSDTGACTDTFTVASPATPVSRGGFEKLCGTNTGQHIYIDTGRDTSEAATITLNLATTSTTGRSFKIKVSMINCDSPMRPPNNCLQYFTGVGGRIKSFNSQTQVIKNLNYNACLRQEMGYCGFQLDEASSTTDSFRLEGTASDADVQTGTECTLSYIALAPDTTSIGTLQRFCGDVFGDTSGDKTAGSVTSNVTPFNVHVVASSTDQAKSEGFDLKYRQIPC